MTLLEKIFSVKNEDCHKVLTCLGMKLRFKSRKQCLRRRIGQLRYNIEKAKNVGIPIEIDESSLSFLPFKDAAPLDDPAAFPDLAPITIIIPVYNAFEHLKQLTDLLFRHTADIHDVIFVDDASTDDRIKPFLEEIAKSHKNVRLINNEKNYGFSHNINLAASMTERDFVILNTDTLVPDRWVPRLFAPLWIFPENTASVTPLSDNAFELSVPYPLPRFQDDFINIFGFEKIDRAISSVSVDYDACIRVSGLGFAMAISRKAWAAAGPFAEEIFGRGYREESDWCLRARRAGFENRVAANLFIPHHHNGSFTEEERKTNMDRNMAAFLLRNPEMKDWEGKEDCHKFARCARIMRSAAQNAPVQYGIGYFAGNEAYIRESTEELQEKQYELSKLKASGTFRIGYFWTCLIRIIRNTFHRRGHKGIRAEDI